MSKALLSSFRAVVLLTLFFNLVFFLVFLSRALRRCCSPANTFSTDPTDSQYYQQLHLFLVTMIFKQESGQP